MDPHSTTDAARRAHLTEYLCMRVPLPEGPPERSTFSLTGFEPIAEQSKVHHMLLFGCQDGPANTVDDVWNCMMQSACQDTDVVLYGWGRNAPPVTFPPGYGYTVGARSSNKHLVLQIHFLDIRPRGDTSGLRLTLSSETLDRSMSLQAFARGFMIPPGLPAHPVKNECCYNGAFPMTTFASRVHTHDMGRRVSLDVTTPSNALSRMVVDIDPLRPQGFYPANKTITIQAGDRMEVTCEFDSTDRILPVYAGPTHKDEMCNLYLMGSSTLGSFSMCVVGSHLIKRGHGLGTNVVPKPDALLWDTVSHHVKQGFGQIPGLFYSSRHPESVWMFYRRDADWKMGTFADDGTMTKDGFVRGDTVSLVDLRTGAIKKSLGGGLFMMPHMISEAEDGSLWVTDVGAHLVHKLSPETGEVLATLGGGRTHRPNNPGSDSSHFCKPTEAIETRDGRVLVSDGYCNNRVVEFDAKTLKFVREHDIAAAIPDEYKLLTTTLPHSLTYDECAKTAFIALRIPKMVVELNLSPGVEKFTPRTYDLRKFGQPMALRMGMYGGVYALTMGERETHLVELSADQRDAGGVSRSWQLQGPSFAHDFVFVPSPMHEDGSMERNVSIIVSETKQQAGSRTFKYVFVPDVKQPRDSRPRTAESAAPDAAIHVNTDDLVLSAAIAVKHANEHADDRSDEASYVQRRPADAETKVVFLLSMVLLVVVLWGFLQTLGITMRSMNSVL